MSDVVKKFREDRRKSEIKSIAKDRKIDVLCHFTRVENLESILRNGLLSRRTLTERNMDFFANDNERLDGNLDAICLSVSFPNFKMFYMKRSCFRSGQQVRDSQWVVLVLDARILWELECQFCQQNAASILERNSPRLDRREPKALHDMFFDTTEVKRLELNLPRNFPTDPQAEVLVFGQISTSYLRQVHFHDIKTCLQYRESLGSLTTTEFCFGGRYFIPRMVNEKWE